MDIITWLIVGSLIVGAATIAFSGIKKWIRKNKNRKSKYAAIVKQRIRGGKYRLVSGIFDKHDVVQKTQVWEGKKIDKELERQFQGSDTIYISV